MVKFKYALPSTLLLLLVLAACGGNEGGATTCGDFKKMDSSGQVDVIKKFLDSEGSSASNGKVTLTRLSAIAYCKTAGSDSDPISNING